jgi:hypothetical protein
VQQLRTARIDLEIRPMMRLVTKLVRVLRGTMPNTRSGRVLIKGMGILIEGMIWLVMLGMWMRVEACALAQL